MRGVLFADPVIEPKSFYVSCIGWQVFNTRGTWEAGKCVYFTFISPSVMKYLSTFYKILGYEIIIIFFYLELFKDAFPWSSGLYFPLQ